MRFILLFFLSLLVFTSSKATHLVGGEIYYEYLGNDSYGITLKVYRDCGPTNVNDTQYDDFASVGIFVGNTFFDDISLSLDEAIVNDIPVQLNNPCFALPPNVCVEEAIYYGTVDLPFGPTYDIIYERCCRNPSIINLVNPDDTGAIFRATIPGDDLVSVQNNSASFDNFPPVALCSGVEFNFEHSASDPDPDVLRYSFCQPYHGGSPEIPQPSPPNGPPYNNVVWENGFSTDYPIEANPAFEINEITGLITGTPTQVGQYVIGICVTETRNGVVINTVNRDFQFNVSLCDPTIIAAIPSQETFCDGLTFEFSNTSINGEFYLWDFGDPTTDLDISTEIAPTYTYPDTGQYLVTMIVNPNWTCADTSIQLYTAYPVIQPVILQDGFECIDNVMSYDFEATGEYDSDALFEWEFENANISSAEGELVEGVNFFNSNEFSVSLTLFDNGCEREISNVYTTPPSPIASFASQDLFCQGFTQNFDNLSENAESYFWDFGVIELIDDISLSMNPQYVYPDSGRYEVMLIAEAPFTCPDTTYSEFEIQFLLDPFFVSPGSSCFDGNSFDFLAEGWEDSNTQFLWEFGEFASPSVSTSSAPSDINFSQTGTFDIMLTADVMGCEESFQSIVEVIPNPNISFSLLDAEGCSPLYVSLLDSSYAETTIFYEWSFGDGSSSFQSNPSHQYLFPGLYDISLTISTLDGCAQTLTQSIEAAVFVYPNPSAGFDVDPNTVPFLAPDVTVTDLSEGAVEVIYTFGDGGYFDIPDFDYSFSEAGLISVNQTVFNEYGCFATAEGEVAVEGFEIYVPNAFTPNEDGINDVFLPQLVGVTDYIMVIYNRWGEVIFETTDQDEPWLGQVKDGEHFVQNEIYQYRIFVRDLLGYPHDFEGTVTILR